MDDEHHFTLGPAGDELWSTAEEERTFSLIRDLLMQLNERGSGLGRDLRLRRLGGRRVRRGRRP
jgi:hypothetical protein